MGQYSAVTLAYLAEKKTQQSVEAAAEASDLSP